MMSNDWKAVTSQVAEASDNVLVAHAQIEEAETKARNATLAMIGLEDDLAQVKEQLSTARADEEEATAQWEKIKAKLDRSDAESVKLRSE